MENAGEKKTPKTAEINELISMANEYDMLMRMLQVSVSKHMLNEHFTLIWANDFYYKLIGWKKEDYEANFHNQCDLYYRQDQEEWDRICAAVQKAIEAGQSDYTIVTKMRRKNGEYIWVKFAGSFTDEYCDGLQTAYTVITNINDIMLMQNERAATYDNLPGMIAKYRIEEDLEMTLLDGNESFFRFFGEQSWRNRDYDLYRWNMDQNAQTLLALKDELLAGEPVNFVMKLRSQKAEDRWMQINAGCYSRQNAQPVYLVIYTDITDVTQLRQMQTQLEEQAAELRQALEMAKEANLAKSDFLSRMSHDIRTPMNAIVGMTEIAFHHREEPERIEDCLKKISLSSKHLLGLINDVLDMSAIESGKMAASSSSVSLPQFMDTVIAIVRPAIEEKGQKLFIRLHSVVHENLYCDALRLRQAFINLFSNATKFTPEGGSIILEVEERPCGQPGMGQYRFLFEDTGIGMRPEFVEHIFDAFTRERDSRVDKTEGSGLGMAITKKIIDMLGGTVRVESEPGVGSRFIIDLPMQLEADRAEEREEQFPGLHILVVDDDRTMCEYAAQILSEMGVQAEWTDSGEEAVANVESACEKGDCYDAIFLDWKMPDMDGVRVVRELRKTQNSQLPILIVSAYDWSEIEEEARLAGADGFIAKPLFRSTLQRAIHQYICKDLAEEKRNAGSRKYDFSGKTILLVEDNELNQEIAEELFSSAGAKVETVCNGAEGCAKFSASPEKYYDLILMDIQMPVMNGYEAARTIRRMDRQDAGSVPIFAMTADAFAKDIEEAKQAGMNGHLAKPLDIEAMMRKLQTVLV